MRHFRTKIPFILSLLPLLRAQECDPAQPLGPNCDSSAPGIAINGMLRMCSEILNSCPGGFPTSTSCVQDWCQTGCADDNHCCASSNAQSCFQGSPSAPKSGSGTGSNSGGAGNGGGQSSPAGASMCTAVANIVSACESSTLGFTTLPNSQQASCLCFNDGGRGKYNGTFWDDAASTCYSALLAESASQSLLNAYSTNVVGACTRFVDAGVLSSAGVRTGGSTGGSATPAETGKSSSSSTSASGTASPTAGAQTGTSATVGSPTPTKSAADGTDYALTMLLTGFAVASFALYAL